MSLPKDVSVTMLLVGGAAVAYLCRDKIKSMAPLTSGGTIQTAQVLQSQNAAAVGMGGQLTIPIVAVPPLFNVMQTATSADLTPQLLVNGPPGGDTFTGLYGGGGSVSAVDKGDYAYGGGNYFSALM